MIGYMYPVLCCLVYALSFPLPTAELHFKAGVIHYLNMQFYKLKEIIYLKKNNNQTPEMVGVWFVRFRLYLPL